MKKYRTVAILLILIYVISWGSIFDFKNVKILALENGLDIESPELTPSFSDIDIDINDSLIISYEDINTDDYECSINSEGITASIIEENGYLQCEVEAINNIEFGTM